MKCLWKNEVFFYDGDRISEWCEVVICSGKVVAVYLLADRNYVYQYSSNIGVPYLLLPPWVEFRVVSFDPEKS